jgi:hypothetical protein
MRFRFLPVIATLVVVSELPAHADHFFTNCNYSALATATDDSTPLTPLSNGSGGDSSFPPGAGGISCSGFGGSASVDGTRTYPSSDSEGNPQDAVFLQSGRATASGSVSPGHISLSASGSATSSPGAAPAGSPFARLNLERATGQGSAAGSWTDYFTIVGAPGTSVMLGFTSSFSGTFTTGPGRGAFYDLAVYPCSNEPIACDPITGFGPLGDMSFNAPGQQTINISGFTSDTFEVIARASVDAGACAGGTCVGAGAGLGGPYSFIESDSESADFSHTAALSVVDLTPGTSFTTASGFDYAPLQAPTVPEPSSLALLSTGLLGLGIAVRRKPAANEPGTSVPLQLISA